MSHKHSVLDLHTMYIYRIMSFNFKEYWNSKFSHFIFRYLETKNLSSLGCPLDSIQCTGFHSPFPHSPDRGHGQSHSPDRGHRQSFLSGDLCSECFCSASETVSRRGNLVCITGYHFPPKVLGVTLEWKYQLLCHFSLFTEGKNPFSSYLAGKVVQFA